MILEGLRLMAVGMFTVFAFLTLLVGLMNGSALFFEKFADRFPDEAKNEPAKARIGNDEEIALVIALAEAARLSPAENLGKKV
jgi:sodium pump decarboxylase gamma subunit